MEKKSDIEKIKYYDNAFWIGLWALIIFLIALFMSDMNNDFHFSLIIILLIIGFIASAIFNWGMLYHMFKGKHWGWVTFFIISFFLVGGFIATIPFYFIKKRKEFNLK